MAKAISTKEMTALINSTKWNRVMAERLMESIETQLHIMKRISVAFQTTITVKGVKEESNSGEPDAG